MPGKYLNPAELDRKRLRNVESAFLSLLKKKLERNLSLQLVKCERRIKELISAYEATITSSKKPLKHARRMSKVILSDEVEEMKAELSLLRKSLKEFKEKTEDKETKGLIALLTGSFFSKGQIKKVIYSLDKSMAED